MTNDVDQASEPGQHSTVTDWHGQEVALDIQAADEALALANGDETTAEEIFHDIRPDHPSQRFKVPAAEREGTLVTDVSDPDHADAAVRTEAPS